MRRASLRWTSASPPTSAGPPPATGGRAAALVGRHPLQERLWAHRMVALYRDGRQADASGAFDEVRQVLAEQLGLEPGPSCATCSRPCSSRTPALILLASTPEQRRSRPSRSPSPPSPAPRRPPAPPRSPSAHVAVPSLGLIGRREEVDAAVEALGSHRLVTFVGPAGVGKTRLAAEVASLWSAESSPVRFLELSPLDGHDAIAEAFAACAGVTLADGDTLRAVLARLRDEGGLLVLDCCEHVREAAAAVAEQVVATAPDGVGHQPDAAARPRGGPPPDRSAPDRRRRRPFPRPLWRAGAVRRAADRGLRGGRPVAARRRAGGRPRQDADRGRGCGADRRAPAAPHGPTAVGAASPPDAAGRTRVGHDLLAEADRTLYGRLAVFSAGGRFVRRRPPVRSCPPGRRGGARPGPLGRRLARHDLRPRRPEPLAMLDTMRELAAERLEASHELDTVRARHLRWCREPVADAGEGDGSELEREHDNLRARWSATGAPSARGGCGPAAGGPAVVAHAGPPGRQPPPAPRAGRRPVVAGRRPRLALRPCRQPLRARRPAPGGRAGPRPRPTARPVQRGQLRAGGEPVPPWARAPAARPTQPAGDAFAEVLAIMRRLDRRSGISAALDCLADVADLRGDHPSVVRHRTPRRSSTGSSAKRSGWPRAWLAAPWAWCSWWTRRSRSRRRRGGGHLSSGRQPDADRADDGGHGPAGDRSARSGGRRAAHDEALLAYADIGTEHDRCAVHLDLAAAAHDAVTERPRCTTWPPGCGC